MVRAQMARAGGVMGDVFCLHFMERAHKIQNPAVHNGAACLLRGRHFLMPMIDMGLGTSVYSLNPLLSTRSSSSHCVDMKSGDLSFVREGIKGFLTSTEGQ